MLFKRKGKETTFPPLVRMMRLPTKDLEDLLESSLAKTAELFHGLTHRELDRGWLLAEMETQLTQATEAVRTLQRRVEA